MEIIEYNEKDPQHRRWLNHHVSHRLSRICKEGQLKAYYRRDHYPFDVPLEEIARVEQDFKNKAISNFNLWYNPDWDKELRKIREAEGNYDEADVETNRLMDETRAKAVTRPADDPPPAPPDPPPQRGMRRIYEYNKENPLHVACMIEESYRLLSLLYTDETVALFRHDRESESDIMLKLDEQSYMEVYSAHEDCIRDAMANFNNLLAAYIAKNGITMPGDVSEEPMTPKGLMAMVARVAHKLEQEMDYHQQRSHDLTLPEATRQYHNERMTVFARTLKPMLRMLITLQRQEKELTAAQARALRTQLEEADLAHRNEA